MAADSVRGVWSRDLAQGGWVAEASDLRWAPGEPAQRTASPCCAATVPADQWVETSDRQGGPAFWVSRWSAPCPRCRLTLTVLED